MNWALLSIDVQTWLQLEPSIQMKVFSQLIDPLKPTQSNPTHPIKLGWFSRVGGLGLFVKKNLYVGQARCKLQIHKST